MERDHNSPLFPKESDALELIPTQPQQAHDMACRTNLGVFVAPVRHGGLTTCGWIVPLAV